MKLVGPHSQSLLSSHTGGPSHISPCGILCCGADTVSQDLENFETVFLSKIKTSFSQQKLWMLVGANVKEGIVACWSKSEKGILWMLCINIC